MNEIRVSKLFKQLKDRILATFVAVVVCTATLSVSEPVMAETYKLNFRDTDIHELIKFVADATDTTIVVDPKVKGKVKVISSKPVSSEELYNLFLSILDVHGFTAIRTGNVIRIRPSKDARSAPVMVTEGSDGRAEGGSDRRRPAVTDAVAKKKQKRVATNRFLSTSNSNVKLSLEATSCAILASNPWHNSQLHTIT